MEQPTKRSSSWYSRQSPTFGQGNMPPMVHSAKTSWGQHLKTFGKRYWFPLTLFGLSALGWWKKGLGASTPPKPTIPTQPRLDPPPLQLPQGTYTQGEADKVAAESNTKSTPLSMTNVLALPSSTSEQKTKKVPNHATPSNAVTRVFNDDVVQTFCKRFEQTILTERKKFGIPSSIILANAILHSQAGKRNLTLEANNHFALQVTPDWHGKVIRSKGKNYRQYETAWLSFRDHSLFLSHGKYAPLSKQHSTTDYKNWARGIQSLGYPTDIPNLAEELVKTIERHHLQRFDAM